MNNMWDDDRYSQVEYVYGKEPNDFLVEATPFIPKGRVLCLAEGQGRNAVYLASQGYAVTGIDASAVGLAKAQQLAVDRGVKIETIVEDLSDFRIQPDAWDGIVSIFCHLPPHLRADIHRQSVAGLRSGGVLILEAYTPRQLEFKTRRPTKCRSDDGCGNINTRTARARIQVATGNRSRYLRGRISSWHRSRSASDRGQSINIETYVNIYEPTQRMGIFRPMVAW